MGYTPPRGGALKRLGSILLWSVIAAAFIGPGTVTTAASAGASHGFALLWALLFSTVACLVLQEASGRLTVVSGRTLGQVLKDRYSRDEGPGLIPLLVVGAILLGCAAYEAGNILGGVAGAVLAMEGSTRSWTLVSGAVAAGLLWFQSPKSVARLLSLVVAVMGVAFLVTAWRLQPSASAILAGSLRPTLPTGAGILVLGLVGTTVVPYNLFLGSGLADGQRLSELRLGLALAVGLGGLISMGVLVVGAAVDGAFTFEALAAVLADQLGGWASRLFAVGLLGAGLSSAITAPLAAAITARDLLSEDPEDHRWSAAGWRYRAVWLTVLLVGVGFGISGIQPIPVIILAQAVNGVLLPGVAIFLFLAVNDRRLLGERTNGMVSNLLTAGVVGVSLLLGISALLRAVARAAGLAAPSPGGILLLTGLVAIVVGVFLVRGLRRSSS